MELDWNNLWQEARKKRTWQGKKKEDWNKRAAGFARRNSRSPYVDHLLKKISVKAHESVLDVGCGPGTLSIPLARMVRRVTALDFSPEMLEMLRQRLAAENIENVRPMEGSWEDDWQALGVEPHDCVLASRSLAVEDLQAALVKLNTWAKRTVILADRVGSGPFDSAMFDAVGRPFQAGPDYIYTVNILYQMGIHARVDFVPAGVSSTYQTQDEAYDAWVWMFDTLSLDEERRFKGHMAERLYRNADGSWSLRDQVLPKWAVIQWER